MIIHRGLAQGSDQWRRLRLGVVTASCVDSIITPETKKARTGKMPRTYLATLVGERLLGRPLDDASGPWMERGTELEAEARDWLAWQMDVDIEQVAFLSSDCGRWGASPDGVVAEAAGVELKCLSARVHVGCLLDPASLEAAYATQVQFGLWVSGWSAWTLAAFCPGLPGVVREVKPDAAMHAAFAEHIPAFADSVDAAVAAIKAMETNDDFDPIGGW